MKTASLTALLCVLGMAVTSRADDSEPPSPNILLIVADDLGFSDLGCFGGEIRTPHLDELAAGGVRLTQFYNTGRCCPSRASILTGQYPHRVGLGHMVNDLGQPGYRGHLAETFVTVADVLQSAGYRTFLSGKWHVGTEDPTRHGFDGFYGTLISARTYWNEEQFLRLPEGSPRRTYAAGEFYATDAVTDQALDFVRQAPPDGAPWFVYLPYHAPHFPLHAPPEEIARYAETYQVGWDEIRRQRFQRMKELGIIPEETELTPRSQYWGWKVAEPADIPAWDSLPADRRSDLARRMAIFAAMVDRLDQNVGRLIAELRQRGELENTLILFTSDNGACAEWDPFGFDIQSGPENILHTGEMLDAMGGPDSYHSVGSGWANASNTPWRLYKHYNHEGGIASPGILHWPARLSETGSIVADPAHIIDLFPTFLDAAGLEYPAEWKGEPAVPLPGESLLPLARGESPAERTLYFEHQGNRAVRQGRWKLSGVRKQSWELYDFSRDRTELHDLSREHPDVTRQLAALWEQWARENFVLPFPKDYKVRYLPKEDDTASQP
jgi:arylsulfatase A-like enzyme